MEPKNAFAVDVAAETGSAGRNLICAPGFGPVSRNATVGGGTGPGLHLMLSSAARLFAAVYGTTTGHRSEQRKGVRHMTIVQTFGYLAIGVQNLDEGVEFYGRFARLDLTERIGKTAFMTGGTEHHWVRLEEGTNAGVRRVGYE